MNEIRLRRDDQRQLVAWARAAYPREACGLLVGTRSDAAIDVARVVLGRNLASQPDRFALDPADWLATHERAGGSCQDIVGNWHSHPDADAIPSARDHDGAWPQQACVIVSVGDHRAPAIRGYDFDGQAFQHRELRP